MKQKVKFRYDSSLSGQCYEQIKNGIVSGDLTPGLKLKVEMFKDQFSVGQSPIREALSQLVSTGLVTMEEGKGFRVAKVSEADVRDVYDTFTIVENAALKLAIQRGDANWEARVVAECHKLSLLENSKKDIPLHVWAEQNYKFHQALISGCNSPTLLDLENLVYLKFDRYVCLAYRMNSDFRSVNHDEIKREDHKKLMEAALNRDVKLAIKLMTYHINGPIEDVINLLKVQKLI